jgi:hypothetical protein
MQAMMKIAFVALVILSTPDCGYAQDQLPPKILHFTTSSISNPDSSFSVDFSGTELVVLSLTDSVLYDNFESDVKNLKQTYKGHMLIIAVDRHGISQKGEFMTSFYQNSLKDDYAVAFDKAMQKIRKFNHDLQFKARFFDLTDSEK